MRRSIARLLPAAALIVATVAPATPVPSGIHVVPAATKGARQPGGWNTRGVAPVSPAALVGGRVVLYAKATGPAGGVRVVALDPATGRLKWWRPASAASTSLGTPLELTYDADRVYVYTPTGSAGLARVTAYDAATGQPAWTTAAAYYFGDSLSHCGRTLCATAAQPGGWAQVRINAATGAAWTQSGVATAITRLGRQLGPLLFDSGTRSPEFLVHADANGKVLWSKAVNRLFGVPVSSDNGWTWALRSGVYVGSLGPVTTAPALGQTQSYDAGLEKTVGIRAADGKVLWRKAGSPWCHGNLYGIETNTGVLCTYTGSYSQTFQSDPVWAIDTVSVVGFDWLTGATTFTRPLDATASDFYAWGRQPVWLGAHNVVVQSSPVIALNLTNGRATSPATGTAGWCSSGEVSYQELGDKHEGASLQFPCTLGGARVAKPTTQPGQAGIRAANRFVWADQSGVHAVAALG